jgi:hypothetical protein
MIFFKSGMYQGTATINPIHITFCTKTETAMADRSKEAEK